MLKTPAYQSVPSFIRKIYEMVSSEENSAYASWTPDGKSMFIYNEELFSTEILPKYFKHSNYCSFVRQLNMYSFHKVRESEHPICFSHEFFRRDEAEKLIHIKRKPQKKKAKQETNSVESKVQLDQKKIKKPERKQVRVVLQQKQNSLEATKESILKDQALGEEGRMKLNIWESSISISGELGQPSPRISVFGDLASPRNYFSPINFDAFVCSYRNFLK